MDQSRVIGHCLLDSSTFPFTSSTCIAPNVYLLRIQVPQIQQAIRVKQWAIVIVENRDFIDLHESYKNSIMMANTYKFVNVDKLLQSLIAMDGSLNNPSFEAEKDPCSSS